MKKNIVFCLFSINVLLANPQGFQLQKGEAVCLYPDPYTLEVQTTDKAIIHWDSFDIHSHERTRFTMPNPDSYVLNRVQGGNFTAIFGKLESNGHLFLVNPKGIFIADDAYIETAGFIASTFDILDKDFCQGKLKFNLGEGSFVHHKGLITAINGDVHLMGTDVIQEGSILSLKKEERGSRIFLTARGGDLLIKNSLIDGGEAIFLEGFHVTLEDALLRTGAIQAAADGDFKIQGKSRLFTDGSMITTLCADQGFQVLGEVDISAHGDLLLCANGDLVIAAEQGPLCIQTHEGSLSLSSNEMILLQGGEEKSQEAHLVSRGPFRLVAGGAFKLHSPAGLAKILTEADFFIEADTISVDGTIFSQTGPLEVLTCDLFLQPDASIVLAKGDNTFRITVDDCGHLILMEGAHIRSSSSGPMSFAINGGIHLESSSSIIARGDLDMIAEEDITLSQALLKTEDGNLDLFVKGNIDLSSGCIHAKTSTKGFLHLFAGKDVHLDDSSQIILEGEECRGLIVADYNNPKAIGNGKVLCERGADISIIGSGNFRIYTSGISEEKFPEYFNQIRGVFYPMTPKELFSPFNVFYKEP